ncbi:MAG TPA: DUF6498-containing protein [Caulobacterales bacterium]|nr:DUF6498-containing protein [Caulobacterales bacterium]
MIEEGAAPEPGLRMARIIGAVLVNLVPVFGVLFGGWSAFALMLLYWLENVVIGVFNAARMIASGVAQGPAGIAACLFVVPFFTFHYGMFCLVHGVFVWTMFGQGFAQMAAIDGPFDLSNLVGRVIALTPGLRAGFISIVIWQSVLFFVFFLGRGEFRRTDPMTQMAAPYGRIIVLHVTILAGGFVVLALGQPVFGVLILALLKTAFDLFGTGWKNKENAERSEAWNKGRALLVAALKARAAGKTQAPPPPG